jgi:hypothetical protein
MLRSSGKQPKKSVVRLSRRLQAPLEPYFALNERRFIGSRQVQKIVKRVAGHSGVGSKSWIEPFRGDMQKTPSTAAGKAPFNKGESARRWHRAGVAFWANLIADKTSAVV